MSVARASEPGWRRPARSTTPPTGRPRSGWSRSCAPARSRRSRSAGCSSAGRGERRSPRRPAAREAALRRAAERAETALAGLDGPLGRYLLELEADQAEGRSWYGEPGSAELSSGSRC